jgi:hypothetical protein
MKQINVQVDSDDIGIQIFDALHAYRQSLNNSNCGGGFASYTSDWDIRFTSYDDTADLNILYMGMPPSGINKDSIVMFDIVLLGNAAEPITATSDGINELLYSMPNVHLVCNSYIDRMHMLHGKIIHFPFVLMNHRDHFCRQWYPQLYEINAYKKIIRNPSMCAISGENRTWRHHFFKSLDYRIYRAGCFSNAITATNHSFFETDDDTIFRNAIGNMYRDEITVWGEGDSTNNYYDDSVSVGINGKFGRIPPGYFFMPEYFAHSCIVYAESTWQNNELVITEKTIKCLMAGSIPFPVGGVNTHKLCNELGIYTAYNLLPAALQRFDDEINHWKRYQQMHYAIEWLLINKSIFKSDRFDELVTINKDNLLSCSIDITAIKKFSDLIENAL